MESILNVILYIRGKIFTLEATHHVEANKPEQYLRIGDPKGPNDTLHFWLRKFGIQYLNIIFLLTAFFRCTVISPNIQKSYII